MGYIDIILTEASFMLLKQLQERRSFLALNGYTMLSSLLNEPSTTTLSLRRSKHTLIRSNTDVLHMLAVALVRKFGLFIISCITAGCFQLH